MPKKRRSGGRSKGSKGSVRRVQCAACGKLVPIDKAKKVTTRVSFLDPSLAKELRRKGAYISTPTVVKYYCISCAVHRGISPPRSKEERTVKNRGKKT